MTGGHAQLKWFPGMWLARQSLETRWKRAKLAGSEDSLAVAGMLVVAWKLESLVGEKLIPPALTSSSQRQSPCVCES